MFMVLKMPFPRCHTHKVNYSAWDRCFSSSTALWSWPQHTTTCFSNIQLFTWPPTVQRENLNFDDSIVVIVITVSPQRPPTVCIVALQGVFLQARVRFIFRHWFLLAYFKAGSSDIFRGHILWKFSLSFATLDR